MLVCVKTCDRKCTRGHRCRGSHKCSDRGCPPCIVKVPKKLACRHTVHVECHKVDKGEDLICEKFVYGVCGGCGVKVRILVYLAFRGFVLFE